MARGKKTGHVRSQVTIKDDILAPMYILMDDSQFVLMTKSSTIPLGYYSQLGSAIKRAARYKVVEKLSQETVNLQQFIDSYEGILSDFKNQFDV